MADSFPVEAVLFCSLGLVAPALAWLFPVSVSRKKLPIPESLPVPHGPGIPVVLPVPVLVLVLVLVPVVPGTSTTRPTIEALLGSPP